MSSFIVELVSSASSEIYPQNSLSAFTNFLPEQLNLEGDWEVALLEISYPSLINNVTSGKFWYIHKNDKYQKTNNYVTQKDLEQFIPCRIEPGLYQSTDQILIALNENLKKNWKGNKKNFNLNWSVNQVSRKIDFELPHKDSLLVLGSPDLSAILGFPVNYCLDNTVTKSVFPTDILRFHSIMVYTDIIEYSVIGDTKAPILRGFPFEQRLSHDRISVTKVLNNSRFDNLQYRRLLKNSIHSIRIELRSQTGELIPFLSVGVTRLTLVFRQR